MDESAVVAFARGVKFRHDAVRGQWVILAPERALVPDATAVAVLKLIDGAASLAVVIDRLAEMFAAPRAVIAGDVLGLVWGLVEEGVLRIHTH